MVRIILDQTAPKITSATAVAEDGNTATATRTKSRLRTFRLRIKARDNASGLAAIQVAQRRAQSRAWQKFRSRLRFRTTSSRALHVRVRDRAANQ